MIVIDHQGTRIEIHGLADMGPVVFDKHVEFARRVMYAEPLKQLPPPRRG